MKPLKSEERKTYCTPRKLTDKEIVSYDYTVNPAFEEDCLAT